MKQEQNQQTVRVGSEGTTANLMDWCDSLNSLRAQAWRKTLIVWHNGVQYRARFSNTETVKLIAEKINGKADCSKPGSV